MDRVEWCRVDVDPAETKETVMSTDPKNPQSAPRHNPDRDHKAPADKRDQKDHVGGTGHGPDRESERGKQAPGQAKR
jgi:hypothetical protein